MSEWKQGCGAEAWTGARPTPTHAWAHSINATHQRRCRALSATAKTERERDEDREERSRQGGETGAEKEWKELSWCLLTLVFVLTTLAYCLNGSWSGPEGTRDMPPLLGLAWTEYSLLDCCCCRCCCHCRRCCCWLSHNYFDSTFTTSLWITQEVLAARRRVRLSSGKASLLRWLLLCAFLQPACALSSSSCSSSGSGACAVVRFIYFFSSCLPANFFATHATRTTCQRGYRRAGEALLQLTLCLTTFALTLSPSRNMLTRALTHSHIHTPINTHSQSHLSLVV